MCNIITKEEYIKSEGVFEIATKEEDCMIKTEEIPMENLLHQSYKNWSNYYLNYHWSLPFLPFSNIPYQEFSFQYKISPSPSKIESEKPCKIIKNEIPSNSYPSYYSENDIQREVLSPKKKRKAVRVSACKNYIGLICAGFSRTILGSKNNNQMLLYMKNVISRKKTEYETIGSKTDDELFESVKKHIFHEICGKKVKRLNHNRDFKIRNSEELANLLNIKPQDTEKDCFRKEVLKELLKHFFVSESYYEWLSNGMMSESNRGFLLSNKIEIQNKFLNPLSYKPRFTYASYQ